jgi:transcriptional regulator with XRE-family HTH domain
LTERRSGLRLEGTAEHTAGHCVVVRLVSSAQGASARERHWTCAARLRERRKDLGLTQVDVVARLQQREACLTNRTLSAMENGRGLDLGVLPDLAAVLDCSITYLLGLTADPTAWQPDRPLGADSAAGTGLGSARGSWILGPDVPESTPRSAARTKSRAPT